jgi:DNA-binding XRE family transcriptional regulator
MKGCTECGERGLVAGPQPVTRVVGERTFQGVVQGWACPACKEVDYDGPGLGTFEEQAATWLAEHGVRSHAELKFMRKAAGIRASDLAAWLSVTPETVSHWETGKHTPDVITRGVIASIVLDALRGQTVTRDRLKAQRNPESATTVRLDAA